MNYAQSYNGICIKARTNRRIRKFTMKGNKMDISGNAQRSINSCRAKKKEKSETTKIAVNQEEQSVDLTLRGNKRGADYLQSLLSGKLMLNQFNKMHLFRHAADSSSRGNLWSLLENVFSRIPPLSSHCLLHDLSQGCFTSPKHT